MMNHHKYFNFCKNSIFFSKDSRRLKICISIKSTNSKIYFLNKILPPLNWKTLSKTWNCKMINNLTILRIWKNNCLNKSIQRNNFSSVHFNWLNLVSHWLLLLKLIRKDKNHKAEMGSDFLKAQICDKRKKDRPQNQTVGPNLVFLRPLQLYLARTHKLYWRNLFLQKTWLKFRASIFSKTVKKIDFYFKFIFLFKM